MTGIRRVPSWLNLAVRCVFLDRQSYRTVTQDPYMTGPALLIILLMQTLAHVVHTGGFDVIQWLSRLALWFVGVLGVTAAGYLLTRQGDFTRTFRGVGFAQSVYIVGLLALIPGFAPAIRGLLLILAFVATWIGAAAAFDTRGWYTVLLPVMAFLVLIVGLVVVEILLTGASFSFQGVLATLGLQP